MLWKLFSNGGFRLLLKIAAYLIGVVSCLLIAAVVRDAGTSRQRCRNVSSYPSVRAELWVYWTLDIGNNLTPPLPNRVMKEQIYDGPLLRPYLIHIGQILHCPKRVIQEQICGFLRMGPSRGYGFKHPKTNPSNAMKTYKCLIRPNSVKV